MFQTEIPEPRVYKGPIWQYLVLGGANIGLAILGTVLVVGGSSATGRVDPLQPFLVLMFYLNGILWLWRSRKVVPEMPVSTVLGIEKSEQLGESHK